MSAAETAIRWIEKVGDLANPILVKETRQALKSRQFIATFLLLLFASWIASVFGLVLAGGSIEYGQAGRTFFSIFYSVLALAVLVVVPFGAFGSLLGERNENTFELLSITSLTPRQIVLGKLLSSMVQVFLYYSAITPFIAFTSLLQGFDFAQVTYLLALLLVVSIGYTLAALLISTLAKQRHTQVFLTLGMLALAGNGFFSFLGIAFGASAVVAFDDSQFWVWNGVALLAYVTYLVLFLQVATAQLTFESDNRSTGIRLTLAVQFWLFWIAAILLCRYYAASVTNEEFRVLATLSTVHWAAAGMFAVSEPDSLSRRIRRGLPGQTWRRVLLAPFLPGGSRGYFYVLLHLVALLVIVLEVVPHLIPGAGLTATSASTPPAFGILEEALNRWGIGADTRRLIENLGPAGVYTVALSCYVAIYLGMSTLIGRLARGVLSDVKPGHIRMITVLTAFIGVLVPLFFRLTEWVRDWTFAPVDLLNPISTMSALTGESRWTDLILFLLTVGATIMILVNVPAMVREVRTVVRDPNADNAEREAQPLPQKADAQPAG